MAYLKKKEEDEYRIVARPSPMDRTHIQQKKTPKHFQKKTVEVYDILVWHTYWECPFMLLKQRRINDILTQREGKLFNILLHKPFY